MPLSDTGLVVRYYIDEAASGTGPTSVVDAAADPFNLTPTYGAALAYVETDGDRGVESTATSGTHRLSGAIDNTSDKVRDAFGGVTQATIELVVDVQSVLTSGNGSNVFGINETTVSGVGELMIRAGGSAVPTSFTVFWNSGLKDYWDLGTAARAVFHIVIDTTQASSADRVKVYRAGSEITSNVGNAITQNDTLTLPNGSVVCAFNNEAIGSEAFVGTLFYGALYTSVFDATRVSDHYDVLTADDDTPAGGGSSILRQMLAHHG